MPNFNFVTFNLLNKEQIYLWQTKSVCYNVLMLSVYVEITLRRLTDKRIIIITYCYHTHFL